MKPADVLRLSPVVRERVNEAITLSHPEDKTIEGVSHVMWTGSPINATSDMANAVFYGDKAIDRSPCGTGTSARMAQLAATGRLKVGDHFVHESIIGSQFTGCVESATKVGDFEAIIPSIEGWAVQTGYNTIFLNEEDPFVHGFQVV
jgi:4-hydroxyproline epimerase